MSYFSAGSSIPSQNAREASFPDSTGNLNTNIQGLRRKERMEKSARDFESILIGQWLEQAEKSFATVPGEDPEAKNQDPGQDQMRSIAFHALADGLAAAGGLGIAALIRKHLVLAEGDGVATRR